MAMDNRLVAVLVAVRPVDDQISGVLMDVAIVLVRMEMSVDEKYMVVFMVVVLAEMKPNTKRHEQPSRDHPSHERFAEHRECHDHPHEWSDAEIGAGPR